jgi:hypothetical protein
MPRDLNRTSRDLNISNQKKNSRDSKISYRQLREIGISRFYARLSRDLSKNPRDVQV